MSAQKIRKSTAEDIATAARAATKGRGLPPVHLWNPAFCGDLDIRIARDGTWFYLGTPIGRAKLMKLFSSILRKDGDKFFLVTPVEKVGIIVDDAPFVAIDFTVTGSDKDQVICFETNVGDYAKASMENPIRFARDEQTDEPSPYIHIRNGLEALIDRKSFYRLVDLGTQENIDGEIWFGVFSSGTFFPIIPSKELEYED
tara:strand:+ start:163 stop:762 length:600 start_codon:yes stop_codon:yes gene_type:complete